VKISNEAPEQVQRHTFSHETPILVQNERRTRWVVFLTIITMMIELLIGWYTNSMALMADGWHMATHAGALGLTLFGYWFARKYDDDPRFSFGTGKVFALTGFASAIALAIAGILVAGESLHHMLNPENINFDMAMKTAVLGLVVNLISAMLLANDEATELGDQSHGHSHGHSHDHNLRGAYLHVVADALTSVLAIVALALGKWFGWVILDPVIGILGGIIICRWALSLCKDTAWVLLDAEDSTDIMDAVYECIVQEDTTWIVDLHIWDLGLGRRACVLSVVSKEPKSPDFYKAQLANVGSFFHINVEVFSFIDEPKYRLEHSHHHNHEHSHHSAQSHSSDND
jgi:cation diffusion facilitator family transporter